MSEEEIRLIKGYFNDGYCCDLDELKEIANKMIDLLQQKENIIKELEKYLEEEKDRLAGETSAIYEDSLGKTRLVNEDIFNEIIIIQDKIKALKGDSSNE